MPRTSRVVILAGLLLAVLSQTLGKELSYDEAYTVLCYAIPGAKFSLTHLTVPNNHMLYSALIALLAPVSSEPLYRVLSMLFALGTVWLTLKSVASMIPGAPWRLRWVTALAIFLAFPPFLVYATQLLGYSMSMLLVAALLALVVPHRRPSWGGCVAYGMIGAAALGTLISNALPLAMLAAFDLARSARGGQTTPRELLPRIARHVLAGCGAFIYIPVWRDLTRNAAHGWGRPATEVLPGLVLPLILSFGIITVGLLATPRASGRPGSAHLGQEPAALLAVVVLAVTGSLLVSGMRLYPRAFLPVLPIVVAAYCALVVPRFQERPRLLNGLALATAVVGQVYWQASVNWLITDAKAPFPRAFLPPQFAARDFDPYEAVRACATGARPPGGCAVVVDNRDQYSEEMAFWYYAVLEGMEKRVLFAPRSPKPLFHRLEAACILVVSRDAQGRDDAARAMGFASARFVPVKTRGFFKVWRAAPP